MTMIPALFSRDWTHCFVTVDYAKSFGSQLNPVPPHQLATPRGVVTVTTSITSCFNFAGRLVTLTLLVADDVLSGLLGTPLIIGRDTIEWLQELGRTPSAPQFSSPLQFFIPLPLDDVTLPLEQQRSSHFR